MNLFISFPFKFINYWFYPLCQMIQWLKSCRSDSAGWEFCLLGHVALFPCVLWYLKEKFLPWNFIFRSPWDLADGEWTEQTCTYFCRCCWRGVPTLSRFNLTSQLKSFQTIQVVQCRLICQFPSVMDVHHTKLQRFSLPLFPGGSSHAFFVPKLYCFTYLVSWTFHQ